MRRHSVKRSAKLISCALLSSVALAACGAKSGLEAPDVEMDASLDVASLPDVAEDVRPLCIEPAEPDAEVPPLVVDLSIEARLAAADVLFVVDRTGSMSEEIDNIRTSLRSVIVPGLIRTIPDLNLGLVTYGDFPVEPFGASDDRLFSLERPMGREFTALQGALGAVVARGGGDSAEALTEALFQVATGEGLRAGQPGREFWIPPAGGCRVPGNGYACIRPRATPIIVAVTDAPTHNGPSNRNTYEPFPVPTVARPHTYSQAVAALNARLGAKLIGIHSGAGLENGRSDLEAYARDTRSLGSDGRPLVFDINPDGTGLSEQVVSAVTRLANEVRLDVSARAVDADGSGGAAFVLAVNPRQAVPMSNVQRIESGVFVGVIPGTELRFDLVIDRARIVRRATAQRYVIRIEFLEAGRPTLGSRDVVIAVPGIDEPRCPR
jgi:predicted small lipoprotein YifL